MLAGDLIEALAPAWRRELARLLPEVDPERARAPASPNHPRLFEAFAHLLEQMAATRPLLVVLEDGHWADEMSLRLLAFLARRLPATRLLLVVTVREEEAGDAPVLDQVLTELDRESRLTRVRLAPLSRADITALVLALLEDPTSAAGLADEAWSASEGNPFFAVETVRARIEDGLSDVAGLRRLPERLQLLVSRRFDRLSARGRHLAMVTAVIGKEAPLRLLALAAGMSEGEAADEAGELVQRRILAERPGGLDIAHERVRGCRARRAAGARAGLLAPARRRVARDVPRRAPRRSARRHREPLPRRRRVGTGRRILQASG
jgi:predicted ATPase